MRQFPCRIISFCPFSLCPYSRPPPPPLYIPRTHAHTHTCIYIYTHTRIHVYTFMYTHTHTLCSEYNGSLPCHNHTPVQKIHMLCFVRINSVPLNLLWDTTLTADVLRKIFYFQEQLQTVIKLCFYAWLCQFLMKIIPVIKWVCACVETSVEDDNFPREGWGCVNLMTFIWVFTFWFDRESIIPGNFGFAFSVCRLRERASKSVYVHVFHDLELLRYVLRCAIKWQL